MMSDSIRAVMLGIIEGVTEFLPVSSTGHLLLAERFFNLGDGSFWNSFTVLIQLGAILAILVIYFAKLWRIALGMFSNPYDRRFVIGVLVAFLPPVVIGLIAGKYIKELLVHPWGGRFFFFLGNPDHGGGVPLRFLKNRGRNDERPLGDICVRLRRLFRPRDHGGEHFSEFRPPPRLHAVRMVARHRRHPRSGRAGDGAVGLSASRSRVRGNP